MGGKGKRCPDFYGFVLFMHDGKHFGGVLRNDPRYLGAKLFTGTCSLSAACGRNVMIE
jgi:hypothetical protein